MRLKKTLFDSLKKLLIVVLRTEDPQLQNRQLLRLHNWYQARESAQMTKEAIQAAKIKQEILMKK